jgi:hypothetical protein
MDADILNRFWKQVKRTYNPKWSIVLLSRGDIRNSLNLAFSDYTRRFLHTEKRCDGLHTVLWIRKTDLQRWRAARGIAAIRQFIGDVFAEQDGRRLFPDIYQIADEIKEQRRLASKEKKSRTQPKTQM